MIKKFANYFAIIGMVALTAVAVHYTGIPDAIAQTPVAVPSPTEFDIATIKSSAISILAAVLLAVSSWVGITVRTLVAKKIDLDKTTLDEKVQAIYDLAAKRAISYTETFLNEKIPEKLDPKSVFVKTAAEYLKAGWPDVVKYTGMTQERLENSIIARLPSPTGKEADALAMAKAGATVPAVAVTK